MRSRAERQRRQAAGESRSVVWPALFADPKTLSVQVWDAPSALSIPAVGKALHVHQLAGVMPLDCYRGVKPAASRPRLLEQPDLSMPGSTRFVQQHVSDWLISGNACHLVTARDAEGWPAAVRWRPSHQWAIKVDTAGEIEDYFLQGKRVPRDDVVHVAREAEGFAHARGIGIVEQYIRSLDRVALEEESERQNLRDGSVPSVAVITPNRELEQDEVDDAADSWMTKLSGPGRRPAILPNGTQVIPLTWSASEQQMIEARKMSLIDVANMTGLDAYWLGHQGGSHNYKSPGPMWLTLLRMTLEPMIRLFEDAWSQAWLPRGKTVRLNRLELTRDDLETSIRTVAAARAAKLMTYGEGRVYLGWDPDVPEPAGEPVVAPIAAVPDTTTDDEGGDGPAGEGN